jgi:DNA polymerase I
VRITFWLLDLNVESKNNASECWLWGIDRDNRRILVIDKFFNAFFYAVVSSGVDASKVALKVSEANLDSVVRVEAVSRRFFGKPVEAVKVYCKVPDVIPAVAKSLRRFEGIEECFEEDIRPSMQYLLEHNLEPCAWHEAEVERYNGNLEVRVDAIYTLVTPPAKLDVTDAPPLQMLAFSTVCYSREGTPKPERNPVVIISTVSSSGEQKQFVAGDDLDDVKVIRAFMDYVHTFNPDVIFGFGTNKVDWVYLRERSKRLGFGFSVDKMGAELHSSVYGHVSLNGMVNLDLADFVDEFPDVKVKALENFADYLGIMKRDGRVMIENVDYADYWDDKDKRELLKRFSMDNALCVMGIGRLLFDFGVQLSSLVGLPLDHVMAAAVGFRVEWFMIRQAKKRQELVPKRVEQPYVPYSGGLVLKPRPGVHENIAVLDFKSMYPSIMIAYNVSPDTYVPPSSPVPEVGVYEAPDVGHRFRKEPPGFYKEILLSLIHVRKQLRVQMAKTNMDSPVYRVLDARQKAVKVITNAVYGYAGWAGARWYSKPVAEAATAWGRHTIMHSVKLAESLGLRVIYGDTDSLFITYDADKIDRLTKLVMSELSLEIEFGKLYKRVFFTEAKKRYAGLLNDGKVEVIGLEVARGDWAEVARRVQEHVLEIILKEQSTEKAVAYVKEVIKQLREKKIPFRDLVIWKTLTKPAEEYAVKAAHVEAARMLEKQGWHLSVGDKVGYVVTLGAGRLYERVKPYVYASYHDIDVDYYVTKQVVPAAVRVLEFFGVSEEMLLSRSEKKKGNLVDFVGGY